MVVYRGLKPEMKNKTIAISYPGGTPATAYNLHITAVTNGADYNERIGSKIKVWNVEYLMHESNSTDPTMRVDFYLGNSATDFSTHVLDTALDRQKYPSLKTMMLNSGSLPNNQGAFGNLKLPLGVITRYDGTSATSVVSNSIHMRINTSLSTTVSGYIRIWYTDA